MTAIEKGAGRYKPGSYLRPEPKEVVIDGLGSFLVQPLSTKEQEAVEAKCAQKDGESEEDHAERLGYAKMAAAIIEPKITAAQIKADAKEWTPFQGGQFVSEVQMAAQAIDEEVIETLRRRFREEN